MTTLRLAGLLLLTAAVARAEDAVPFRADPTYEDIPYSAEAQKAIYGGKHANRTARPLLELGRPLYKEGQLGAYPHLWAYGDLRTAAAANDNGGSQVGTAAVRLNLDVDLGLTATERIHAFFRPFDNQGKFTRIDLDGGRTQGLALSDVQPQTLFYEGEKPLGLPLAAGLIPLVLQNGVWLDDAFLGGAVTLPARHSGALGISNMDLTVFGASDKVSNAGITNAAGKPDDHAGRVYGAAAFIEANQGYWEVDYGYTDVKGALSAESYHNASLAFTRRYWDVLSNSVRVIWNGGQSLDKSLRTADGELILIENSFGTKKPMTLVPYLNLFAGFDRPQSLARDPLAGGVLKNTGILFETDGVTGFPKMDDTGRDTYGGAVGIEYLFSLDQQLVLEAAALGVRHSDNLTARPAKGAEYGVGARWQLPLDNAWLVRADLIAAAREGDQDLSGVRIELRRKF